MNRGSSLLGWSLAALTVLLTVLTLLLLSQNHLAHPVDGLYPLGFLAFGVVGGFIAAHRPNNLIGWLFCVIGLSNVLNSCALQYAVFALRMHPGTLPGGEVAAVLGMGWVASIGWGSMGLFIPLLFPTGRLLSPRWRPIAALGLFALGVQIVFQVVAPVPVDHQYLPSVRNPLGVEALGTFNTIAQGPDSLLVVICMAAGIMSLVLRYRRAGVEERLQIKWFAYAAAVLVCLIALAIFNNALVHNEILSGLSDPLFVLAVSLLPLTAAVAILRYRLYDIDLLINRTLVYGSLTITLAALYLGGVIGLQVVFRSVTGQNSELAIAIATLAVAGLFNPWRRQLQTFIDRRFYRRKYDAVRILASFSTTLRDEVDLDHLTERIAEVVEETVAPSHVSLWLAEEVAR